MPTGSVCWGQTAAGCCEQAGLDAAEVPLLVGTLGKAFGSFGAFVAGDAVLIEYLMQRARTYIYTTALPRPSPPRPAPRCSSCSRKAGDASA